MARHVIAEVASVLVIKHEIQMLLVLERVMHVDDERVFQTLQNLLLVQHHLHRVLSEDSSVNPSYFILFIAFIA